MAGQELKLLGAWYTPYAHIVEMAMKLKGIEYELVEEDLWNKSPLLLKYNPVYKKVPVLVHNEKPIAESLVIIEYLDDNWKQEPILPQDPYEKALARFWAKFIEEKFAEAIKRVLITKGDQQVENLKQAKEALRVLEQQLKGKKFFGGQKIGLVDIVMGYFGIWSKPIEEVSRVKIHDPESYPCIEKWMHAFVELPIMKEKMAQQEMLVPYMGRIRQIACGSGKMSSL